MPIAMIDLGVAPARLRRTRLRAAACAVAALTGRRDSNSAENGQGHEHDRAAERGHADQRVEREADREV